MPRIRAAATILSLVLHVSLAHATRAEPLTEEDYDAQARRVVPRDAFPVLFDPPLASVEQADAALEDDELVIGVAVGNRAQAYPVRVMGVHAIVNDVCGDVPIAASW